MAYYQVEVVVPATTVGRRNDECTKSPRRMPSGNKRSALHALRTSVESGFFSYPYINKDPLLNGLHAELAQILNVAHQRHEAFKNSFFR